MSLKALIWVMEDAPVKSPGELLVLYALAERAHDDGRCAWPSQEWIAHRARCSTRTVRNHLKSLEEQGLIKRGDQRLVSHLRKDRRPVVWNLDMTRKRAEDSSPRRPTAGKSESPRPEDPSSTAGKSESPRPETPFLQTVLEPSHEPSIEPPPVVPQGGHDELSSEIAAIDDTTPATTEPGAPGRKRGSRLPEGFMPSAETIASVRSTFPGMESEFMSYEHEKFMDYWTSVSGSRGTKLDWNATWRNWMKRAVENLRPAERQAMFGQGQAPQPQKPSKQQQSRDLAAQLSAEGAFAGRRLKA